MKKVNCAIIGAEKIKDIVYISHVPVLYKCSDYCVLAV